MLNVVVWFSFKGVFNCWIWSSSHTRVKIKNACIMPKREPGYYISKREDFLQQACYHFWHSQFWRQKVKEKYPTDWLNKAIELDCSNWHNMNIEDPPEFFFGNANAWCRKSYFAFRMSFIHSFDVHLKENIFSFFPFPEQMKRRNVRNSLSFSPPAPPAMASISSDIKHQILLYFCERAPIGNI